TATWIHRGAIIIIKITDNDMRLPALGQVTAMDPEPVDGIGKEPDERSDMRHNVNAIGALHEGFGREMSVNVLDPARTVCQADPILNVIPLTGLQRLTKRRLDILAIIGCDPQGIQSRIALSGAGILMPREIVRHRNGSSGEACI